MPYKSDAQRRFMHARHPEIAAKWDAEIRAKKKVHKSMTTVSVWGIDHGEEISKLKIPFRAARAPRNMRIGGPPGKAVGKPRGSNKKKWIIGTTTAGAGAVGGGATYKKVHKAFKPVLGAKPNPQVAQGLRQVQALPKPMAVPKPPTQPGLARAAGVKRFGGSSSRQFGAR